MLKTIDKSYRAFNQKLTAFIFWNFSIRFLLESYCPIMHEACARVQQFYGTSRLSTFLKWLDQLEYYMYLILPALLSWVIFKNYHKIKKRRFRTSYEEAVSSLTHRRRPAAFYPGIFCYRRLLLAVIVVQLAEAPYWQIMLNIFLIQTVIICVGYIQPFKYKSDYWLEMANEAVIMICAYHFLVFSDFVPNAHTRFLGGSSLIAFSGLSVVMNLGAIYLATLREIYRSNSSKLKRWKRN